MTVFVVMRGDGYGHNDLDCVFGRREDAEKYKGTNEYLWIEEQEVLPGDKCEHCGRGGKDELAY